MFTHRMSRRALLKSMAMVAAGTVVSACAPGASAPPTEKATAETGQTPAAAKAVKLLFYAGGATPTDPNATLAPGDVRKVVYQKIADSYREAHPNVEIEWYRAMVEYAAFDEWMTARITAQDMPDIFWSNPENLWPHVSKGWFLDYGPAMDTPNPYVAGNSRWRDQFYDVAITTQTGPDGKIYGTCFDGIAILTAYSETAFEKAGIAKPPKTYAEFLAVLKQLKDAGYIPIGGDMSYENWYPEWYTAPLLNQLMWDTIFKYDDDGNKQVQARECVIHYQKGDFPDWDADLKASKLLKDSVPYLPEGWQGKLDLNQLFRQGKTAMMYSGSWEVINFKKDPPPFPMNWMDSPIITKDMWPTAPEKSVRIAGPWGSLQYHSPAYIAKQDPGKVNAIFDWLMYSSKPEHVTELCVESGLMPLTKGASGMPGMGTFAQPFDRAVPYQGWENLSEDAYRAQLEVWGAYLPVNMSDKEYLDLAKATLADQVRRLLEQNPDWKI